MVNVSQLPWTINWEAFIHVWSSETSTEHMQHGEGLQESVEDSIEKIVWIDEHDANFAAVQ